MLYSPAQCLLAAFSLLTLSSGQLLTAIDPGGNIVLATIMTNARGTPTSTRILSTISVAPQVQAGGGGAAAAPVAVNGGANTICSTPGCPVAPTVYMSSGIERTFYPTAPPTPIPTIRSSGAIVGISQYITTTLTATGLKSGSAPSLSHWRFMSEYGVMGGIAMVGGLVGAAMVL